MERARSRTILAAGVALVLAACSGSGADTASSSVVAVDPTTGSLPDELFTETETGIETESGIGTESPVESIAPVAETGVPGIDSDDAFCRAWSEYAGSVQGLSLAWAVQPAEAASVLEVAASGAVIAAIGALGAHLPPELESNRSALTVDVPGPFLRRAERARQLLIDAGLGDREVDELGDAWIEAIGAAGLDAEDVSVTVPPGAEAPLDSAAEAFRASVPSILEDPTLDTTEFDITPSLDYIFEACPDRGTLAGNDVIDG